MNTQKNQYHIDVTEEEDAMFKDQEPASQSSASATPSFTFKKALVVVFAVHAVGLLAVFGLPVSQKTQQTLASTTNNQTLTSNTTAQNKVADSVPVDQTSLEEASSVALTPKQPQAAPPLPSAPIIKQPPTKTEPLLTKEYTVKQGDTIYGIAKKYKLNTAKLLQINAIKDPSKIVVGQKLKFL
jgi:LysM repeat protein